MTWPERHGLVALAMTSIAYQLAATTPLEADQKERKSGDRQDCSNKVDASKNLAFCQAEGVWAGRRTIEEPQQNNVDSAEDD